MKYKKVGGDGRTYCMNKDSTQQVGVKCVRDTRHQTSKATTKEAFSIFKPTRHEKGRLFGDL